MHILLVEDDLVLGAQLDAALRARGLIVDRVTTGGDGLAWPNKASIGLVILDKGLPDMDGAEFVEAWRAEGLSTPILLLSAQGDWRGKVECLNAGADDYVVKPVEVDELVARARVLNRRMALPPRAELLQAGGISLDPDRRQVMVDGREVMLSAMEYRLLELLMKRQGGIVTKSQILDVLYPLGEEPQENAIEAHVSRLRRKIGGRIASHRGQGYALEA